MTDEQKQHDEQTLSEEELEEQQGEELPDREVTMILPIDPTGGSRFLPEPPA
jgi:hypothetical protein